MKVTTIQLNDVTKSRLSKVGKKGNTYDDILNDILDFYEKFKFERK